MKQDFLVFLDPHVIPPQYATRLWHDGERLIATFPVSVVREELRPHAVAELAEQGLDLWNVETVDLYYSENDPGGRHIWGFLDAGGSTVTHYEKS